MSANERALKDKAHQFIRKGKLQAASELYLVLITQNAKDPSLRLHHAELCDKLNRPDRAVASYQVAAHLFAELGHITRARAAINCGLRISPRDGGLLRAMRELTSEATPFLSLVPPPIVHGEELPYESGFIDVASVPPTLRIAGIPIDEGEALTDPYCPLPDWLEVSPR